MELIHTFSLVHDDLPAMDDDDLRRGRPTNHKVSAKRWRSSPGDAMVTMAFELLATDAEPAVAPAMVRELASNSGPAGMIGGQVLDIDGENQQLSLEGLQQIHRMKTGRTADGLLPVGRHRRPASRSSAGDYRFWTASGLGISNCR